MSIAKKTIEVGADRSIEIETGKMALLAGGSVTVRQGDTIVLVAACQSSPRPGLDFFPLQVDYREKFSAAGRFPGGYFKREGRPGEKEILTARMTDRPLRPMFPNGFIDDVQIMAGLLSADCDNESDVLCMLGASAALMVSDIPFYGPIGTVRVGRVNGEFIANPTHEEMEESDLDLIYSGVPGKVIMIEGSADEISEEVLRDALTFADPIVTKLVEAQRELMQEAGKPRKEPDLHLPSDEVVEAVRQYCTGKLEQAYSVADKQERKKALSDLYDEMAEELSIRFEEDEEEPDFKNAYEQISEETVRRMVLDSGKRMDGRGMDEVRPISCEAGLLPRVHGSALFSRGDTQALVSVTLGPEKESQDFDAITGGEDTKKFFLHYNFPNFSVGETGRIAGPGRREIGHGALAERCIAGMLPEDYPYAVRCLSDILGSNGSSSMASVCGASLALMDAGVPVKDAVVGISVGLVFDEENNRKEYLVDILGEEDHFGDMDFKIAGTAEGITGFQLDLKLGGLDVDTMYGAMLKSKQARSQILDSMNACIAAPREEMSPHAPRVEALHINPERIGALIGPGGKVIRGIVEETGADIDVEDDGTVKVFASDGDAMAEARRQIEEIAAEPELNKIYKGTVKTIKDFGAFVEIIPGTDGLLHISELADYRVKNVEEICKLGETVTVKVIEIDDRGRVRLSRRAALAEE